MKCSFLPFSSVGYISQYLSRVGELLPNVLANTCEPEQFLAFADDEIFAKSAPILLDVPVFNYCFSETQKNKALERSQFSTCTDFTGMNINASPLVFYG